MFGYIRVDRPELKVREETVYKALYCGLCKAQKVCTGQCSRLTLSYDFVFLSLVRMALTGEEPPKVQMKRCVAHPFRKRPVADRSPALDFCAYASALLTYHKVEDDRLDEKGKKRLLATLVRPWVKKARKRALHAKVGREQPYAHLDRKIQAHLEAIHEIEKEGFPSADRPAEMFGQVMADMLVCGADLSPAQTKLAANIGRHIGRWVYLIDALDDYEEDRQKGRYNPFVCLYGNGPLSDEHKEQIRLGLCREIVELEHTLDLLDPDVNLELGGLLYNIVTKGLPRVSEGVLDGTFRSARTSRHRKAERI